MTGTLAADQHCDQPRSVLQRRRWPRDERQRLHLLDVSVSSVTRNCEELLFGECAGLQAHHLRLSDSLTTRVCVCCRSLPWSGAGLREPICGRVRWVSGSQDCIDRFSGNGAWALLWCIYLLCLPLVCLEGITFDAGSHHWVCISYFVSFALTIE